MMRSKRIQQLGSAAVLTSMLTLGAIAPAFASSDISNTGPDSTNKITNSETTTVHINNDNDVHVTNSNNQSAESGSAKVSGNTTAGDAQSGDARNSNNVSTSVAIGNSSEGVPGMGSGSGSGGGSGSGAGAGSGSSAGAGSPGSGAAATSAGLGGGAGVAMLPATGCSATCDVDALRAAYKPYGGVTATALKNANKSSALLMGLAALLSLVAAGGSAYYSTKQRAKA